MAAGAYAGFLIGEFKPHAYSYRLHYSLFQAHMQCYICMVLHMHYISVYLSFVEPDCYTSQ